MMVGKEVHWEEMPGAGQRPLPEAMGDAKEISFPEERFNKHTLPGPRAVSIVSTPSGQGS